MQEFNLNFEGPGRVIEALKGYRAIGMTDRQAERVVTILEGLHDLERELAAIGISMTYNVHVRVPGVLRQARDVVEGPKDEG